MTNKFESLYKENTNFYGIETKSDIHVIQLVSKKINLWRSINTENVLPDRRGADEVRSVTTSLRLYDWRECLTISKFSPSSCRLCSVCIRYMYNERTWCSFKLEAMDTAIVIRQLARKLPCCSYDQLWIVMMGLHDLCRFKFVETLIDSWAFAT